MQDTDIGQVNLPLPEPETAKCLGDLIPGVGAFLRNLMSTAELARHRLDQAILLQESIWHVPMPTEIYRATDGLDTPMEIACKGYREACVRFVRSARVAYHDAVAWYAHAVILTTQAIVARETVTVQHLEACTIRQPDQIGTAYAFDPWETGLNRSPLPPIERLTVGRADIDQRIRSAYEPVAAAYAASSSRDEAERWKLLHTLATALTFEIYSALFFLVTTKHS